MIAIDKEQQLKDKALGLGKRYKEANKIIKIEVGELMIGKRKQFYKKNKK